MPLATAYFRPDSLEGALSLLAEPHRLPLAGGTVVNATRDRTGAELVDLQDLGLNGIDAAGGQLRLGAMTTLAEIAEHPSMPPLVSGLAQAEEPSTLRTLATVGGSVASGNPDSRFIAALLVSDARVELAGADDQPLADLLTSGLPPGVLITAVTMRATATTAHHSGTGRTPADVPIVAAIGLVNDGTVRLALTGVAPTPVLVDPAKPSVGLSPPSDFRGSAAYRLELARIHSGRVLEVLA